MLFPDTNMALSGLEKPNQETGYKMLDFYKIGDFTFILHLHSFFRTAQPSN